MTKLLTYNTTNWIKKSKTFTLFIVRFQDNKGNIYEWIPRWDEIENIFKRAYATEELNNGENWQPIVTSALQVLIWYTNNIIVQGISLEDNRKVTKESNSIKKK